MPDKETSKEMTDADHVKSLLGSDGWSIIKAKLDTRLLDLQNIHNLDMTQPDTLGVQLAARKMAVEIVWQWLTQDVVGFVEQQELNNQKILDKGVESFIGREL